MTHAFLASSRRWWVYTRLNCVHTSAPQIHPQDVSYIQCISWLHWSFEFTLNLSYVHINASRSQATDVSYTGNPCTLGVSTAQCVCTLQLTAPITATNIRAMSKTDKVSLSIQECWSCTYALLLCFAIFYYTSVRFHASCDLNNLRFKRGWKFSRFQLLKVAQTLECMWCSTWCSTWFSTWCVRDAASITQNRPISIY